MKVAFWGEFRSFDYHHIGGTDSIARRLSLSLVKQGIIVDFIHFNCSQELTSHTSEGIGIYHFTSLSAALRFMAGRYNHVVTIYVPPKQRFDWIRFRQRESHRTRFHRYLFRLC